MNQIRRYVLLACLLLALIPVACCASEGVAWQDAYRDFIFNQGYLKSGKVYRKPDVDYSYEEIRFALYDMDHDGTPEVLTTNSDFTHAEAATYVFSLRNGAVSYVGDMGSIDSLWYYPDSGDYTGLFDGYGQMGMGIVIYYTKVEDDLKREDVTTVEYGGSTPSYSPLTQDQRLIHLYMDHGKTSEIMNGTTLVSVTDSALRSMGWEAFLALYDFSSGSAEAGDRIENPLIAPAYGEIVSLWEEENITVRWRRVEGAKSYRIEIMCAWSGTEMQHLERTLYAVTLLAETLPDQEEFVLVVPVSMMDLSAVPHHADLDAAVTLQVIR